MREFNSNRYDQMIYRRCGRSGLMLPAVSLGAWETFGGYKDQQAARDCIFRAFDLGITHFDFANNYGKPPGNAEKICGEILKELRAMKSFSPARPAIGCGRGRMANGDRGNI